MWLDIHHLEPKLMESYLSLEEESLPTKLIISEASYLDKNSWRSSSSLTKSTYQLMKSLSGTHPSKKAYLQEDDMQFPSTLKNKPLIPQSQKDIPNPTELI